MDLAALQESVLQKQLELFDRVALFLDRSEAQLRDNEERRDREYIDRLAGAQKEVAAAQAQREQYLKQGREQAERQEKSLALETRKAAALEAIRDVLLDWDKNGVPARGGP